MHYHVAMHRADDTKIVDNLRLVRKQVRNLDARLSILLERTLRAEQSRCRVHVLILHIAKLGGPFLAIQLIEQRLGIESLEMRWPTRHENENECLRPGMIRHVRRLGRERIVARRGGLLLRNHRGESQRACSTETIGQKLAAVADVSNVLGHISSHKEMR